MRDSLQDDTAARLSLPAALRTNGTVTGTPVDMAGAGNAFRTAMLLVLAGAVADGTHTVVLEDSDNGATGWAPVADADRQGVLAPVMSGQANTVQRQSYIGAKRYLRASVTTTGATTGGTVAAVVLLHQGTGAPVT